MEPAMSRKSDLIQWLENACQLSDLTCQAMPGDASFRHYFRIQTPSNSFVAMDAPPPHENCQPFVAIANAFRKQGLQTPVIIQSDIDRGFLLLSDFGDDTYLKKLNADNADALYTNALDALSRLQACRDVSGWSIPAFTEALMWKEWDGFSEWFAGKWLGVSVDNPALKSCFAALIESALSQPQVMMHRDYHSANLMVLGNGEVGILDFQDAFIGPLTYDAVSLLRDCYIDWDDERVRHWALYYRQKLMPLGFSCSESVFLRWFDWMGIERHLKALFTFARKQLRDHQPRYLNHVPRTVHYLIQVSHRYPELAVLHDFLTQEIQPAMKEAMPLCAP